MKTALVTGACGFVGRHMVKRLVDDGWSVTGIDNMISSSALYPGVGGDFWRGGKWPVHLKCNFKFEEIDAQTFFARSPEFQKFDLVVHLAAVVGGRVMIDEAPLAVAEDLVIDAMMFNWATKAKPGKIIYASSSAAYPTCLQTSDELMQKRLEETDINIGSDWIGNPDMSYGWSKLTGEFLAKLAHEKYGLNVACFRPFSGYGEDQHETYPFPAIMQRVINRENPLTVWSDTVRDFIHIDDCINGMLQMSEHINDGSAVNLGTGVATSFSTLARKMADSAGYNPQIEILQDKPTGVFYRVANVTKSTSLGFKPKKSLEEGIKFCFEKKENDNE